MNEIQFLKFLGVDTRAKFAQELLYCRSGGQRSAQNLFYYYYRYPKTHDLALVGPFY